MQESKIRGPIEVVRDRSIQSSADYIEKNISKAMLFDEREALWSFALSKISIEGLFVEFGVFKGYSINYLSHKMQDKIFFGFDSFEGLPIDWVGTSITKGEFNVNGVTPKTNPNVTLVKGYYDKSIPNFLKLTSGHFSFIHFDSDTYESTKLVLDLIESRIIKGTIIIFDEYLGFPNWHYGEFRAWKDFLKNKKIKYEYLGFSSQQALIRII